MTTPKSGSAKVARAHLYKAFLDHAEAQAQLKIAERDEIRIERPVIIDDGYVDSEGARDCTAQEYVEQFQKQLDVMAKAFPEQGEALKDLFEKTGPAKMAGKLQRFVDDEKGKVKALWDKAWEKEYAFDDRVREFHDAGEMTYNHLLDLRVSKLSETDRARLMDDLKPGGELYKSLSEQEDIPSFYVLPEGLIAYNENYMEDGSPVFNCVEKHLEKAGVSDKHFLSVLRQQGPAYGCHLRLITTDGVFPAPGTANDDRPEDWLPKLKAQVMALYDGPSKDRDAMIAMK